LDKIVFAIYLYKVITKHIYLHFLNNLGCFQ
jgi:hypothetical protein